MQIMRAVRAGVLALAVVLAGAAVHAGPRRGSKDTDITFRARVTKLEPSQPCRIHWRWGGEGLGGKPTTGELTRELPSTPNRPKTVALGDMADDALPPEMKQAPQDRIIVRDETYTYTYLTPGVWTPRRPLSEFKHSRGRLFVTFTLQGHKTDRNIKNAELELEFNEGKKVLKRFTVWGPDGPTFGVMIPFHALGPKSETTPEFVEQLGSLRHYADSKVAALRAEPWSNQPVPKLYGFVTDCNGYRPGSGYGCRTTDRKTMLAEYEVLRLIGINGLRGCPAFVTEMIRKREGIAAGLSRVDFSHLMGYPIPSIHIADGRPPDRSPGDGCPYLPRNIEQIKETVRKGVKAWMEHVRTLPVDSEYGLTVDEIGTVFGRSPEGKNHMGACPYCRKAFRDMIRADGLTPADFGATDWEPIRAVYGYWAKDFWESKRILEKRVADAQKAVEQKTMGTIRDDGLKEAVDEDLDKIKGKGKGDPAKELLAARERLKKLIWNSAILYEDEDKQKLKVSQKGWNLLVYYSRLFNCISSAKLFEPLKDALDAENEKKRQALARGETDTPAARQPWVYSYALRGNTFLMGGHSLDFFNFYRYADNSFQYETSNRDSRVWQWDSYLCDVGRSLHRFMGKQFALYVKPHRGAPVQRCLTALARGARVVFWYTYGPDWAKGDTYGGRVDTLKMMGWVARLIAKAEDVTYDSHWAVAPEVAIVRPRTSEFFGTSASWEDGKWVYTALMHAHIPVDALDEGLLMSEDLSRYKAILICGSHLRRDVAQKLAKWVEAGGTLWTDGWGMAEDQAKQPLDILLPVFGLKARGTPDQWGLVPRYGATRLGSVRAQRQAPEGAKVTGTKLVEGSFVPVVGREVLEPAEGTEVLATYADGGAAVTRHRYGKGMAYLVGTWAGVEYAWETMENKPFDPKKRTFISAPVLDAGVRPVVDADVPLVEGILLKNNKTGRLAIIFVNWQFKVDKPLSVTVRGVPGIKRARSLALDRDLPVTPGDGTIRFTLPKMDEGEIVLLE